MASAATQSQPPAPPLDAVYRNSQSLPKLRGNHGEYVPANNVRWLESMPRDTPIARMREKYERDGYVWIKDVLPREDVLDMRQHFFEHMEPTKILKQGTSPREAIFNSELEDPMRHQGLGANPDEKALECLDAAHASLATKSFLEHPALRGLIREFAGWEREIMLNRALIRHNVPSGFSTGIHYDQLFLRAGDPVFLTAWVPIGDVDADGGGLIYLDRSCDIAKECEANYASDAKKAGFSKEEKLNAFNAHMGLNGHLSHDAAEFGAQKAKGHDWLVANYEAGDVVFHSPWMIHGASRNADEKGRIRLSADLRFYEDGANLDQRWMNTFHSGDGL